jgi:hypothetical protein
MLDLKASIRRNSHPDLPSALECKNPVGAGAGCAALAACASACASRYASLTTPQIWITRPVAVAMSLGWPVRQEKDLGKPANLLKVEEALPRGCGVAEERGSRIVPPDLPADREIEHLTNGTTDPVSLESGVRILPGGMRLRQKKSRAPSPLPIRASRQSPVGLAFIFVGVHPAKPGGIKQPRIAKELPRLLGSQSA